MEGLIEKIDQFAPYLEDIRRRIYSTAIIFTIILIFGFLSAASILKFIIQTIPLNNVIIATTSPFQFADIALDIGFILALFFTIPITTYHLYSFIFPALTRVEKKVFLLIFPLSLILFVSGFLYGFFILYFSIDIFAEINNLVGIKNIWDIGTFLTQMILTSALLGFIFEFPLLLSIIVKMGFLDPQFLKDKRRIAIASIFILVSLLPPTDGLSLILMSLPLIFLYEVTIFINTKKQRYVWTRK